MSDIFCKGNQSLHCRSADCGTNYRFTFIDGYNAARDHFKSLSPGKDEIF